MSDESVRVVFPVGMLGAGHADTALDRVMRFAGKLLYAGDDARWHSPEKYGTDFDGKEVRMWPYQMEPECACGHSDEAEKWHDQNPHLKTCYSVVRRDAIEQWESEHKLDELSDAAGCDVREVSDGSMEIGGVAISFRSVKTSRSERAEKAHEKWCEVYQERQTFEGALSRRLCCDMGIEWNGGRGSAAHCTCGVSGRADKWFAEHGHDRDCPIVRPNFLFRATGLEVRWYKYIGREMETNRPIGAGELKQIREAIKRDAALVPALREEWIKRKAGDPARAS
jgi:hypothetical protein